MDDWDVINSYFESNHNYLSKHQIESYNIFVRETIKNTAKTLNPTFISSFKNEGNTKSYKLSILIGGDEGTIKFTPPVFEGQPLLPNVARLRNMTYNLEMHADVKVQYEFISNKTGPPEIKHTVFKGIHIGTIPIMLQSKECYLYGKSKKELVKLGECPFDRGGYFIIDGKEKVIISQERIAPNKLFLSIPSSASLDFNLKGECRSVAPDNKLFAKVLFLYVMTKTRNYKRKQEEKGGGEDVVQNSPDGDDDDDDDTPSSISTRFGRRFNLAQHITVDIMSIKLKQIPAFIIFRALGIESDKDICKYILYGKGEMEDESMMEMVRKMIIDSRKSDKKFIFTQKKAIEYLSSFTRFKDTDYVKYVLLTDFLPNMSDFKSKAIFFGYLINQMIKAHLGIIPVNSRDNYMNKRVDTSGILLGNVFRDFYNNFRNHALTAIDRTWALNKDEFNHDKAKGQGFETFFKRILTKAELHRVISPLKIKEGMYKTFKGNWGMLNDSTKSGIVQDLVRLSYLGYVSHVRRVNTPMDRTIKLVAPHRLGTEQYGYMCPFESPDGANIGLLKHMSVTCEITNDQGIEDVITFLGNEKYTDISQIQLLDLQNSTMVFINNTITGIHSDPKGLLLALRAARRAHDLHYHISFFYDIPSNEFRIFTDSGRCIRPLYISENVDNLFKTLPESIPWYDKSFMGKYMEYIDVQETNYLLIAMKKTDIMPKRHTHCEIHPCLALSFYTNTIPFVNHNQAPRIVFSGQQGKQAIGVYATNYNSRIDTASYILHYPQKNLATTKLSKYVFKDQLPNGENLIVAIATYTGYNQEDSIIINKDSIERGLFNISYFKSVVDSETFDPDTHQRFSFLNPEEITKNGQDIEKKYHQYDKIDKDGIPLENAHLEQGDVMIGKVESIDDTVSENHGFFSSDKVKSTVFNDKSLGTKKTNYGTVDATYVFKQDNNDNLKDLKIRMRKMRRPVLGDKLASMHGQKGVVGMILPQVEMPFTKDGLVPDIIINPHAIPSRMTIGHLIECIVNKAATTLGHEIDGTAYENRDIESYFSYLESKGINRQSNEIMYNARTGEQMNIDIFIGPTYYYRLKHMVGDKINFRNRGGPLETMTKQPTQGRSNDGGLRIGEMETNALVAHGISSFVKESLMERSDGVSRITKLDTRPHHLYVDDEGNDIIYNKPLNLFTSYNNEDINATAVKVPYCFKLFKQELQSLSIKMNLHTEQTEPNNYIEDIEDQELDDSDDDNAGQDADQDIN